MIKPRLTRLQVWNMCFGFFGIQIGFGLQNANASRIFQSLGANIDDLAVLWIAAPATGLLVQPIIGYLSDRTWSRLGRRRPYFFFGALLTSLALLIMPNAPLLWVAAIGLWLMDASINVTMEPFRAFVGDNLPDDQRTMGYATQSLFIGAGAVFASVLPWIMSNWLHIANTAPPGVIPDSVRISFFVGAVCLLATVMWTVFTTREYPPSQLAAFDDPAPARDGHTAGNIRTERLLFSGLVFMLVGPALAFLVSVWNLEKELHLLAALVSGFGIAQLATAFLQGTNRTDNGFFEVMADLFRMPAAMRGLAVTQFFSWFALFAMWIYTTAAVTSVHYGTSDPASPAYGDGADWVGVLFAVYNGAAALAALVIPQMAEKLGRRAAHAVNLVLGGLGLASFMFIGDPGLLWVGMIGVGFAWASILSMPYSILAGALPARKMGVYMGLFNIFIVVPQLLAATVLGALLKTFFDGAAIYALALGAGSMLLAAISVLFVHDPLADSRAKPD